MALVVGVLCWFAALAIGRVPGGLRDLGAASLRYQAQSSAYALLLTSRYPDSSPALQAASAPPPRPRRRSTRGGRVKALRIALYAALVVGWLGLAWLLWGSVVPDGLALPHVDVDTVFGKALVDRAERYERFLLVLWVLGIAVTLGTLAIYARYGGRFTEESAAGPLGTGMLLAMLGLAILWLTQLPFTVVGLWWSRRHDVSHMGYFDAVFGDWVALGGDVRLGLRRAARRDGARAPPRLVVVDSRRRRLHRDRGAWACSSLRTSTRASSGPTIRRSSRATTDSSAPRVCTGSHSASSRSARTTSQANAFAFGVGPSRRVVLWDTLLDGRFSPGEVDVVLAHELGHHSSDHIAKAIGWFALFALPGALVLMLATRRLGGMGDPRAVPLALLVAAAWTLVTTPAQNVVSRRAEAEADWKALQTTRDPQAARGLFREFAVTSLGNPSPPTWAYLLLETHPTLAQRVAMADAWAARQGR